MEHLFHVVNLSELRIFFSAWKNQSSNLECFQLIKGQQKATKGPLVTTGASLDF